jgi:hypothetical protein
MTQIKTRAPANYASNFVSVKDFGAVGDGVSFSNDLQGITMTAWVSAANTVSVRFQNETGGVLDLASGTIKVRVRKSQ